MDERKSGPSGRDAGDEGASRRAFLKVGIGVLGAGVGAVVLAPGALYVLYPLDHATTSGSGDPLPVGELSGFPEGTPVKVDLFSDRVDAWNRIESAKVGSAWVVNRGGTLVAFSAVCPHLGCAIDWEPEVGKFKCPCHRSIFGTDGAVESGPSPRGLDELEVEAGADRVAVRYVRFRQGIAAKEPM